MAPRTRMDQLAADAHLSVPDFCAAYHRAGLGIGESVHVSTAQAKRWLAGESGTPRAAACRVLEAWWREPINTLLGPPSNRPALTTVNTEELLMSAGRESAEHAMHAAAAVDPAAMEALHAEAARLARAYYRTAPLELLSDLVRLRDTANTQLERTQGLVPGSWTRVVDYAADASVAALAVSNASGYC